MARVRTYVASEVQVVIGTRALRGKSEGTFVKVARDEDSFTKKIGADGEISRAATSNKAGTIEVTLDQTSEDNAYLQGLMNTDENTKNGIVPAKVIDKSGTYVALCAEAWVRKPADAEKGRDVKERTWIIDCGELDMSGGGN